MMAFSAFPNLPGDTGGTLGRAGTAAVAGNTVIVKDLFETLRKFSNASPQFNKEMRKVAYTIAKDLQGQVRIEAGTVSRASQAVQVAKGLRASNDRIPTIKLRGNEPFISKTRPNSRRKKPVTRKDVFFGAEFGGGTTKKTKQFLRHRGQSGYFFWPTVRKEKKNIAEEYLRAIRTVMKKELFK
jgi:hypothetical protein